ncbi:MAG: response regulator, partial [Abitibacteriaceae bacterium]|nr:response regulator [Abditibacteriaceae bacterium]
NGGSSASASAASTTISNRATPAASPEPVPVDDAASVANLEAQSPQAQLSKNDLQDDRDFIKPGDRVLLIIEDDTNFARILIEMAHDRGFKVLIALQGDIGLAMAQQYKPDAITLDLQLPLVDGWTVLDHLKRDPQTRHIPVQVISVMDRQQGSVIGAIAYLEKPVSGDALEGALSHMKDFVDRDVRDLLIVEDNETQRASIIELIGNRDVITTAVGTGEEALAQLKEKRFDCMVLDLGLPDMEGFELLKKVKRQAKYKDLPVVIYTSKDLSKREEIQLKKYAATIITKDATSSERLLDETALFLHRIVDKMPSAKRKVVEQLHPPMSTGQPTPSRDTGEAHRESQTAPQAPRQKPNGAAATPVASPAMSSLTSAQIREGLTGKKVLVVDDDMRNIFALTSVLENYGVEVIFAENGRDGIDKLVATPGIDVVLMDVMMPEMDGYETTHSIRQMDSYATLPIIALTAKAMEGDREKCLAAGASDYIMKPVHIDNLLAMLYRWLHPSPAGSGD